MCCFRCCQIIMINDVTAEQVPMSFADLLCTAASDVIDWAPPGNSMTPGCWQQQQNVPPTIATRPSDDAPMANGSAVTSSAASSPTWLPRGIWTGLLAAQSHSNVRIHESQGWSWTGGLTSSVSLRGFPPMLDAGSRIGSEMLWEPSGRRLTVQGQWNAVPLSFFPSALHARLKTKWSDVVVRADKKLYVANICINALAPPAQHAADHDVLITVQKKGGGSAGSTLATVAAWSRRYIRRLRTGVGLTIKNDLASGVNLFAGAAVSTAGGLNASYHVDVLRRVTISVTQKSSSGTVKKERVDHGTPATANGGGPPTTTAVALRLKLNAITYDGTVMEMGASVPIAAVVDMLSGGASRHHPDGDKKNGRSSAARIFHRVSSWLREEPIVLQCSHSSVGSMVGLRWMHAQRHLPDRLLSLVGDLRMDVTAGVVVAPLSAMSGGEAGGLGVGVVGGPPAPSDSAISRHTTTSSSAISDGRFHSANSTVVVDSSTNLALASLDTAGSRGGTADVVGSPMLPPRRMALKSFFLVAFE